MAESPIPEGEEGEPRWREAAAAERGSGTVAVAVAAAAEQPPGSTGSRQGNSGNRRRQHMGRFRSIEHTGRCSREFRFPNRQQHLRLGSTGWQR